ncbi:MAG: molybdate ABC transporter ATP-binding protein ModF [Desulfuromonadaceae bacterium]
MADIFLDQVTATINDGAQLREISLRIGEGEHWAILGANGSGKSALGRLLCNRLEIQSGRCQFAASCGYVSFEGVDEILARERYLDDSDFLGYPDPGTRARDFILGSDPTAPERLFELATTLEFVHILDRGLRFLSAGEMRKVVIARALLENPQLLVLDEPFDGLDLQSCAQLRQLIGRLMSKAIRVVLLLNRFSEILPEITHIAYLQDCRLLAAGPRESLLQATALRRFHAFHYTLPERLPALDAATRIRPVVATEPLIEMRQVRVSYGGQAVLQGIDWTVQKGEHWQVTGPNGAGKSTLLSLISGDNSQAYGNDIRLFGVQKGSGESIWEIKRRIGLVSAALQQDYRVGITAKLAVVSGFFDSIGVYGRWSRQQLDIAQEWLALLRMQQHAQTPLRNLSYGEQRLILLARAMVKQPELLILDEPCQGLDEINREMVLKVIDYLGCSGTTQLLYVTHHPEDRLSCISHHLELVPDPAGGYTARCRRVVER